MDNTFIEEAEAPEVNNDFVEAITPPPNLSSAKSKAIRMSVIASIEGVDPIQRYQEEREKEDDPNLSPVLSVDLDTTRKAMENIANLAVTHHAEVSPVRAAEEIRKVEETAKTASPLSAYKVALKAADKYAAMKDEDMDEVAYNLWVNDLAAKVYDETSVGEMAVDLLQNVVASDADVRFYNMAKDFGVEYGAGDVLSKVEFQSKFFTALSKLPPKQRAYAVQRVKDKWGDYGLTDNKMDLMSWLQKATTYDDSEKLWDYVDDAGEVVDQTLLLKYAAAPASFVKGIIKCANVLHSVAKLGDVTSARAIAKAASQGLTKEVGISEIDGVTTMLPTSSLHKLVDGAPANMGESIMKFDKESARFMKDAEMYGVPLTEADKTAAIERAMDTVRSEKEVSAVHVAERSEHGFKLEYEVNGQKVTTPVSYKFTDVGTWEESAQSLQGGSSVFEGVLSPHYRLHNVRNFFTDVFTGAHFKSSKIRAGLQGMVKSATKGLKKKEFKRLEQILAKGADQEKVFTYEDLVVNGVGGVRLSEKEYVAYAKTRRIFDHIHGLKNQELLAKFKADNIKKVSAFGETSYSKVYDTADQAIAGIENARYSKSFFVDDVMHTVDDAVRADNIRELYKKGYRLTRKMDDTYLNKGMQAEYAFVNSGDIADATGTVLSYIPGYIPRIREGASFFLKKKNTFKVGDKEVNRLTTERFADNFTELEDYRKTLSKPDDYVVLGDKEIPSIDLEMDTINAYGGLFTGHRSTKPILYGTGDTVGAVRTPFESLQAYINNVSHTYPIALYRDGIKKMWKNTALEAGVLKGTRGNEPFENLSRFLAKGNPRSEFFRQSHDEIRFFCGIPTDAEMVAQTRLAAIGRKLEGSKIPFGKNIAAMLYDRKFEKLPSIVKSATYHSLLGFGNISQVFIQGSGALVALAINPVHGGKGVKGMLEFAVLDLFRKNPEAIEKLGGQFDTDMWKLWDKSGMREGVTNSNLDYASVFNEAPYDANILRKALSKSDMFVNMGEMAYSRIAFGTAYSYLEKKLGRALTEADLPAIMARADDYRLNMTKGNRAKFQKGFMSMPTQFMQVQTKFLEQMMGKNFTTAEKLRLAGAQCALYGSLGMPIIGTISEPILDAFGINSDECSPEQLGLMKKGIIGFMLNDVIGMDVDIVNRLTLGNDFAERALKFVYGDMGSVPQLVLGPSFSLFDNANSVVERMFLVNQMMYNADSVTPDAMLAASKVIAGEMAGLTSTTRNLYKAHVMMNSGMYHNTQGQSVFHYMNNDTLDVLGQAMGFQSSDVSDWYALKGTSTLFSSHSAREDFAKMLASTTIKMLSAGANEQWVYGAAYNTLLSSVLGKEGGEKVYQRYMELLGDTTGDWNELLYKALDKSKSEVLGGLEEILAHAKMNTNPLLAETKENLR